MNPLQILTPINIEGLTESQDGFFKTESSNDYFLLGGGSHTLVSNFATYANIAAAYYTKSQLQTSGQSQVNWGNLTDIPATFPATAHNHDDRYYTEAESDGRFMPSAELAVRPIADANITIGGSTFHFLSNANKPYNTVDGALQTLGYSSQWQTQMFSDWRANKWFVRTMSDYNWGDWQELWHSGNDGVGSGLDADLLDGQQGSYYATAASLGNYVPLDRTDSYNGSDYNFDDEINSLPAGDLEISTTGYWYGLDASYWGTVGAHPEMNTGFTISHKTIYPNNWLQVHFDYRGNIYSRGADGYGVRAWVKFWNQTNLKVKDSVDSRIIKPSDLSPFHHQTGFTSWNNDDGGTYADFIHFGGYWNSGGGSQNLISFSKNGHGLRQWQRSSQDTNAYSDYVDYWHTGNFNPASYVTQSALNTQLDLYATKAGANTFTATNTFTQSPVVPPATLDGHAVNLGQLNNTVTWVQGNYLPLTGGTLTGNLYGTTAYFSGNVGVDANTNQLYGLRVTGTAGGPRSIFLAGQSGFSNGFTVDYDGTSMYYTMSHGNLSVGGNVLATGGNSTQWNQAYNWGNHAGLYMPTTHPANSITTGNITDWNNYVPYVDDRNIRPDELGVGKLRYGFTSWNNDHTPPYADFLHFGGYADPSGGNQNLLLINKGSFGIRQYQATSQSTTPYVDFVDYWHSGNLNTDNFVPAQSIYAANAGRLYANDPYNYGSGAPYYGSLTYNAPTQRWRFEVSPATPKEIEVAYADVAGSTKQFQSSNFGTQYHLVNNWDGNYWSITSNTGGGLVRVARADTAGNSESLGGVAASGYATSSHGHTISDVTGLQNALNGKVDDSQVLTNVPIGAVFTDTIYNEGNGLELNGTTFSIKQDVLTDIEKGVAAHGWGNHATVGYLTGFNEQDPTVPAWVKSITQGNIAEWQGKVNRHGDTMTGGLNINPGTTQATHEFKTDGVGGRNDIYLRSDNGGVVYRVSVEDNGYFTWTLGPNIGMGNATGFDFLQLPAWNSQLRVGFFATQMPGYMSAISGSGFFGGDIYSVGYSRSDNGFIHQGYYDPNAILTSDGGVVHAEVDIINDSGELRIQPAEITSTGNVINCAIFKHKLVYITVTGGDKIILNDPQQGQRFIFFNIDDYNSSDVEINSIHVGTLLTRNKISLYITTAGEYMFYDKGYVDIGGF